jgi:lipid-binding SYLF domain-containing protein
MRQVGRRALLGMSLAAVAAGPARAAASAATIDGKVRLALDGLYARNAAARALGEKAVAVLVFPDVVKGGLVIGGQYGDGALVRAGKVDGYYRSVAASWGLQAGVQTFGYALFFMNEAALAYLERSNGWEVGVGPTLVVVDQGASTALTTTTTKDDIYAFFFDQKGLMAGIGIQGSKITRFTPDA